MYTRKQLDLYYSDPDTYQFEHEAISNELVQRYYDGGSFTLAEEEQLGHILSILRTGDPPGVLAYDVSQIPQCKNFWFRSRYLLYANDLNGYKRIISANGEIISTEKKRDVNFLESEFQALKTLIDNYSTFPTHDSLMDYWVSEVKQQLKRLNDYCTSNSIYGFRKEYLTKSIILSGRFILLLVKEFYQELGAEKEILPIFGRQVLIDGYCYIHTLFRHYSEFLREHQGGGKSYHFDRQIRYRDLPEFISKLVQLFSTNLTVSDFDKGTPEHVIYLKYYNTPYALWFRPYTLNSAGNVSTTYLRAQTFYPMSQPSDIAKLSSMNEVNIDGELIFFK